MIGHDVANALPELRAQAESLMSSSCDIERLASVWDEGTQKSVTTWAPVAMDVPCFLDVPPATARAILTGQAVTAESPVVKIPMTETAEIKADDRVTVDGELVAWVTHIPTRTNQVQRRLECRWVR